MFHPLQLSVIGGADRRGREPVSKMKVRAASTRCARTRSAASTAPPWAANAVDRVAVTAIARTKVEAAPLGRRAQLIEAGLGAQYLRLLLELAAAQ